MSDLGPPFCSTCGGDRGKREPADSDGLGCLDNIYHSEDEPKMCPNGHGRLENGDCPDCGWAL